MRPTILIAVFLALGPAFASDTRDKRDRARARRDPSGPAPDSHHQSAAARPARKVRQLGGQPNPQLQIIQRSLETRAAFDKPAAAGQYLLLDLVVLFRTL